ncbi:MAG TPA: MFS transporter [Candidatus Nanopelagicales bacterium]|nr:MFS transporter [Candidatus Nanopelagicales bacterium]
MAERAAIPQAPHDHEGERAAMHLPAVSARRATLATFVVSGMLAVVWVARMPAIRDALGLTPSEVGSVLLATAVGSIASITVVGRLAVTFGSDSVLRWSLPLMAASAVALGFSTGYPMLLATAALTGLFLGATDVTMNTQASLIERTSGERVLAGMHAGWSFGSAVGAGLAALTAAAGVSVGITMVIASSVVLLAWVLIQGGYLPDAGVRAGGERRAGRIRLPGIIVVIGAAMTLAYLIEGAVIGWSTLYLHDQFGAAAWLAAVGYLGYEIAMFVGRLGGDRVRHRWGDPRTSVVGSAVATVGLGVLVLATGGPLAVAALVVIGLGQSAVVPILFATAGAVGHDVAAAAIARVGGFGFAGMLVGPAAFGVVAQTASMRAGFVGLTVLAVAMTMVVGRGVGPALDSETARSAAAPRRTGS